MVFKRVYLFQTLDMAEPLMDGIRHAGEGLNQCIEKRQKVRGSIQPGGTKGKTRSRKRGRARLLKRLKEKEQTTATIQNHTIAKHIVRSANEKHKGIAIEDLTHIRFTSKRRNKKFRIKLGHVLPVSFACFWNTNLFREMLNARWPVLFCTTVKMLTWMEDRICTTSGLLKVNDAASALAWVAKAAVVSSLQVVFMVKALTVEMGSANVTLETIPVTINGGILESGLLTNTVEMMPTPILG